MKIWIAFAFGRKGSATEVNETNPCREFLCLQKICARKGVQSCLFNFVVTQIMMENTAGNQVSFSQWNASTFEIISDKKGYKKVWLNRNYIHSLFIENSLGNRCWGCVEHWRWKCKNWNPFPGSSTQQPAWLSDENPWKPLLFHVNEAQCLWQHPLYSISSQESDVYLIWWTGTRSVWLSCLT